MSEYEKWKKPLERADQIFNSGGKSEAMAIWDRLTDQGCGEAAFILSQKFASGQHLGPLGSIAALLVDSVTTQGGYSKKSDKYYNRSVELGFGPAVYSESVIASNKGDLARAYTMAVRALNSPSVTNRTTQILTQVARYSADGIQCIRRMDHAYLLKEVSEYLWSDMTPPERKSIQRVDISDLNNPIAIQLANVAAREFLLHWQQTGEWQKIGEPNPQIFWEYYRRWNDSDLQL
jgi:hypothetical protein